MNIDNNGPQAAYPGPGENQPDTGEGHGSGLEQASSEPKQGKTERPADWNPPPGNPGSDQDAQVDRRNGTADTGDIARDPEPSGRSEAQVDPLHPHGTDNRPVSREAVPGVESTGKLPD